MTILFIEGFEHGVLTPTANGGGICNTKTGSPTIQSSIAHEAGYSLRCNTTAANAFLSKTISNNIISGRFYLYYTTEPTNGTRFLTTTVSAGSAPSLGWDGTNNKIIAYIGNTTYNSADVTLTNGTWYCIDFSFSTITGVTINFKVDGVAATASSISQTGTSMTSVNYGAVTVTTGDFYVDDIIVSDTLDDYPFGTGHVAAIRPSSDGVHSAGTNVMEDNAGNDINGTTVTAWSLIDETEMTSTTDYVRQASGGAGNTNYVEVYFGDTSQTVIHGAMAYLAYHAGGTQSNNGQTDIIDGESTLTGLYDGDMSESSLFYKSKVLAVPSEGWTQSQLNALKARMGYSTDATPNPYWDALAIQYDYALSSNATVNAVIATCSSAAVAPTVSVAVNAAVTSVIATSSSSAIAPAVTSGVTITSPIALSSSSATPPTILGSVDITSLLCEAQASALSPSVGIAVSIQSTTALASSDSVAPTLSLGATVQSLISESNASAVSPVISATTVIDATVLAIVSTVSCDALAPVVTASTSIPANVTAVISEAQATVLPPSLNLGASVQSTISESSASVLPPSVSAQTVINATVNAVISVASSTAIASTVSTSSSIGANVSAVSAVAESLSIPPTISAGMILTSTISESTATAIAPTVFAGTVINATIQSTISTASSGAIAPSVLSGCSIVSPTAQSSAISVTPSIQASCTVISPSIVSVADAVVPTLYVQSNIDIVSVIASSYANAIAPTLEGVYKNAEILCPIVSCSASGSDGYVYSISRGKFSITPPYTMRSVTNKGYYTLKIIWYSKYLPSPQQPNNNYLIVIAENNADARWGYSQVENIHNATLNEFVNVISEFE